MKTKALITGINGFVGPYLEKILKEHDISVFGLDKNLSLPNKKIYQADITNYNEVKTIIEKIKPDQIYHLAGQSSVAKSFKFPELTHKINVTGTENIYKACKELNIKPKILIVCSCQIYGIPQKTPINEKEPLKPNSPYAKSRLDQEKLTKKYDIPTIIVRSFNHIGPGQPPEFVVSAFAKQVTEIKKGIKPGTIKVGNLEAKRDFTDVRDIVKAYYLALKKGKPGEIYNIGSNNAYKISEILTKLIKLAEISPKIEIDSEKMRPSDIPILVCDYSKFNRDTNWQPLYNIDTSLQDILNYWENNI